MKLQQLLFVVETAKVGSISKAARNVYVSQPNLSKAIQDLEEELRVTLFTRTGKGVTLTRDGQEFLEYAQTVLSRWDDIKNRFGNRVQNKPTLRLSTNRLTFVTETLLEFYSNSIASADEFELSIREVGPHIVYNDLIEGVSNIAVVLLSQQRSAFWKQFFKSQGIENIYLYSSEQRILIHKDHPLTKSSNITFEDLKKYPLIQHLETTNGNPSFHEEIEMLRYKEFPKVIDARDRSVVSSFLNTTDALFFTVTTVKNERFHPNLVSIPLPDEIPKIRWEFYLLKKSNTRLSTLEEAFCEYLCRIGSAPE